MIVHTPFSAAVRMALMGRNERVSAQAALRLGLVTDVVETGRLQVEAQRVAEIVAKNSPAALAASKSPVADAATRPRRGFERLRAFGAELSARAGGEDDSGRAPA